MKGLGALSLLAFLGAVSATPMTAAEEKELGVCYLVYPQDNDDTVFDTMSKPNTQLPDYTNKKFTVSGITKHLGIETKPTDKTTPVKIYTKDVPQPWNVIVNHEFFVKACYEGVITFRFKGPQDDLTALWTGPKAYKDFRLPEADLVRFWQDAKGPGDAEFNITITKDMVKKYIPCRLVSYNGHNTQCMKVFIDGPIDKTGKRGCLITPHEPPKDKIKDVYRHCPEGSKLIDDSPCLPFAKSPYSVTPPPPPPDDSY